MEGREQEEETDGTGLQQVHRVGVLEQTDGGLLWQVHRVRGSGGDSWGGVLWQEHRVGGSGTDSWGGGCGRCTGSGVLEETGIAGEQAGRESTPGRGPGE